MIQFGTDGWRAIMAEDFTFGGVRRVAHAISRFVLAHQGEKRGIVIGYDTRFLSSRFADSAAQVLANSGIRVRVTGRDTPTPVIAHAVTSTGAFGAIMITASHNPPEYNGIKFIPEYAGPASPEITAEIESYLPNADIASPPPQTIEVFDPRPAYLAHLSGLVDIDRVAGAGLNLYYDAMYATGRGYLDALLTTEVLHAHADPLFGGAMPEPKEEFLGDLIEKVRQSGGLGLATDGDADRFGVVDSDGSYITPNQLIVLLLHYLVEHRGLRGAVARTVATTHLIDRVAARFGLPVRETPVGFKYIGACMRQEPVVIGGEESGGLSILGHIPEKDGVLACALAAEMRATTGEPLLKTLKKLMDDVGPAFSRRVDIHIDPGAKKRLMEQLGSQPPDRIAEVRVDRTVLVDGVKMILTDGSWVLVRPSGTEPLVRVYFEAESPELRDKLVDGMQSLIDGIGKRYGLSR